MNDDNKKSDDSMKADSSGKKREIGEGMHSLDSTQAPLRTSDGLPDREAMTGGKEPSAKDEDSSEK